MFLGVRIIYYLLPFAYSNQSSIIIPLLVLQ
jgi:hypothetical protein